MKIKVLHASLSTACDYCVENTVIPANASQCGFFRFIFGKSLRKLRLKLPERSVYCDC